MYIAVYSAKRSPYTASALGGGYVGLLMLVNRTHIFRIFFLFSLQSCLSCCLRVV